MLVLLVRLLVRAAVAPSDGHEYVMMMLSLAQRTCYERSICGEYTYIVLAP